jgi:hypothetical protein
MGIHVRFGAGDEGGAGEMQPMEASEIDVAAKMAPAPMQPMEASEIDVAAKMAPAPGSSRSRAATSG